MRRIAIRLTGVFLLAVCAGACRDREENLAVLRFRTHRAIVIARAQPFLQAISVADSAALDTLAAAVFFDPDSAEFRWGHPPERENESAILDSAAKHMELMHLDVFPDHAIAYFSFPYGRRTDYYTLRFVWEKDSWRVSWFGWFGDLHIS